MFLDVLPTLSLKVSYYLQDQDLKTTRIGFKDELGLQSRESRLSTTDWE